ncbi:MAG: hypothetical protein IPN24_18425 [Betaproteobacteria bacterium]|nr:hypothetical protein [Betaproteobacteria bacterium]
MMQALRMFDRNYHQHGFASMIASGKVTAEDISAFAKHYDRLFYWISNLGSRALAMQVQKVREVVPAATPRSALTLLLTTLTEQSEANTLDIQRLDSGLKMLEGKIEKNPDDYMTAKAGVREFGIDETGMPLFPVSRHNWETLVGVELKALAGSPLERSGEALWSAGRRVEVNLWRRGDIATAIDNIKHRAGLA